MFLKKGAFLRTGECVFLGLYYVAIRYSILIKNHLLTVLFSWSLVSLHSSGHSRTNTGLFSIGINLMSPTQILKVYWICTKLKGAVLLTFWSSLGQLSTLWANALSTVRFWKYFCFLLMFSQRCGCALNNNMTVNRYDLSIHDRTERVIAYIAWFSIMFRYLLSSADHNTFQISWRYNCVSIIR